MHAYRLYFEIGPNDTVEDIHTLANHMLPCYTLFMTDGCWEGDVSSSYVLEVIGTPTIEATVRALGIELKRAFAQDAVLYTVQRLDTSKLL